MKHLIDLPTCAVDASRIVSISVDNFNQSNLNIRLVQDKQPLVIKFDSAAQALGALNQLIRQIREIK